MVDYPAAVVELREGAAKNSYKLNLKELEKILCQEDIIGKKVAVISIAGAFRKGKSFLLNFLVTYLEWLEAGGQGDWFDEKTTLDKFHWRGGCDRDTNGIFLWSKPYVFENQNGEEIVVLLMDTQGTFDHQTTVKECATIFAMSTLLSSVQIFNLSLQIQEDDLNNLRLFTEYAQLAKGFGNEENSQAPFQRLIFLVRDWPNSDDHSYGYDGGEEYLEKILKTAPKQKKELQTLRKNLKTSFDSLLCFLLPHPGLRIARNNSEKTLGKVEPEFEEQLDTFVPSLFGEDDNPLEAKTINGKAITCGELLELFKSYMTIFNSDELPEAKSILDATVDAVNAAAEQRAREKYDNIMQQKMNQHPNLSCRNTLATFQGEANRAAVDIFETRPKLGEKSAAKGNKENLEKYCEARYMEYKKSVEQNIRIVEEKKRIQEEQQRERQRIKAEEERIRREKVEQEAELKRRREEQERMRREQEELLRRQKQEQEQQQREYEAKMKREREEQERKRKEQEEQLRRQQEQQERRQREHEAKMRREREEQERERRAEEERSRRMQEEHERRVEQQRREAEADRRRLQQQLAEIQQEAIRSAMRQSYSFASPSYGGESYRSVGSYSGASPSSSGSSSNIRAEDYTSRTGKPCTRYRDMTTGRFCKNPNN